MFCLGESISLLESFARSRSTKVQVNMSAVSRIDQKEITYSVYGDLCNFLDQREHGE
jgi:hypothetical protein